MLNIVATLCDIANNYKCDIYAITAYNVKGVVKISLQTKFGEVVKGNINEKVCGVELTKWCKNLLVQYKQVNNPF